MSEKIKKCPHCGATAWFEPWVSADCNEVYSYIECNGCGCGTRYHSNTEKGQAMALEAWNKRVIDDELESTKKMLDNAEDEYRQMRDAYFKLHVKYDELVEFLKSRVVSLGCNIIGEICTPCDALCLLRKHGIEI